MVTVVSPPVMMQTGGLKGWPVRATSRAMAACMRAISRVSPSISLDSTGVRYPSSRARRAAASSASRLLPTTVLRTRAENWVARLGRFRNFACSAALEPLPHGGGNAARESRTYPEWRGHPRKSSASGAVGPEPMTSRSSPITSESSSDSTVGGRRQPRQLAAFDAGDVLADGVDLVDVRAAGQQQAGHGLLLFERNGRGGQRQQRRGAAGDEADHQVVRACARRRLRRCAPPPRRRGHREPDGRTRSVRCAAVWPCGRPSRSSGRP